MNISEKYIHSGKGKTVFSLENLIFSTNLHENLSDFVIFTEN